MGYIVPLTAQCRSITMHIEPNDLLLFAQVVDAGSFSRAAERAGLPKSTVSRRIATLEAQLVRRPNFTWRLDVVADRSRDTELGAGVLDLRRLISAVPNIAEKPCYVEQEGSTDSLASARRNFQFLRGLE